MLDVISCRADDIAGKGVNISAGSSREDASFGASCARRLEKKEGSDRWVERTKRFSASKCPKHYGSSRSIGIKLAPGGGSLRARALSRGSVGTLCGTGHCLSADRQNGSPASRTLPLQPSLPLGPLHLLSLLTCPAAAQHETCIRKTAAYPAENESPPRATTVSLAAAAASLAPTAPHTACTLFVRTRWLDGGKNQHAASSPDAPRPELRPGSHLIRPTSYPPATQHGAADSAIVAPPTPATQHRHPATDALPSPRPRPPVAAASPARRRPLAARRRPLAARRRPLSASRRSLARPSPPPRPPVATASPGRPRRVSPPSPPPRPPVADRRRRPQRSCVRSSCRHLPPTGGRCQCSKDV